MYIYIVIHVQIVSLYHKSSVLLDSREASSWIETRLTLHLSDILLEIYRTC